MIRKGDEIMWFYKIKFRSFPIIRFAHAVRSTRYKNIITYRKNLMEFSINQGSALEWVSDNEDRLTVPDESFCMILPDMNLRLEASEKDKPLYLSSVVLKGDFSFERLSTKEIIDPVAFLEETKEYLLLPAIFPLYADFAETEQFFRRAIMHYMSGDAAGQIQALSVFLEITARIDTLFRNSLMQKERFNYGEYYTNKVKKYIENHYGEKITVSFLSSMLSISPNYLCRVFKETTGKTLTQFLTLVRLYHARRIAYEGNENVEDIAKKVGVCNANYLNVLFKRYYGTNLHDCLLVDREISLFHDKPWELGDLTEDVQKEW